MCSAQPGPPAKSLRFKKIQESLTFLVLRSLSKPISEIRNLPPFLVGLAYFDLISLVAIAVKDKPSGWFKSNWVGLVNEHTKHQSDSE